MARWRSSLLTMWILLISLGCSSVLGYRPGDIVPMSKMSQYHSTRTLWHDVIGRHCPVFAVNREERTSLHCDLWVMDSSAGNNRFGNRGQVAYIRPSETPQCRKFYALGYPYMGDPMLKAPAGLAGMMYTVFAQFPKRLFSMNESETHKSQWKLVLLPIAKPTGYTGSDPVKISLQVGREKFLVPWLFIINRKSSEIPMIDIYLRYSGNDFIGVVAKVIDMPHQYIELHPDIRKQFWDQQVWPKHVLVRYMWEERSEIDVTTGFYVLFGSGVVLTFVLAIYILQSSQDKFAKFVMETVAETSMTTGVVAKVE